MNLLLLNPPTIDNKAFIREGRCNQELGVWATLWPPVTLATTGAVLLEAGFSVQIMDCPAQNIPRSELLQIIGKGAFDLVIWSAGTPSIQSDLALAGEIKEVAPDAATAVLGTHVTALSQTVLRETEGLDFIIRNEPEQTALDLARTLSIKGDLNNVHGISFKKSEGEIVENPQRPFIQNPDELPFPAWGLLDLDAYKLPFINKKFLMLSPVRGCPHPCAFCTARTYYGRKLRFRSPEKMVEEISYIKDKFGISHFFIWADTFTANGEYVKNFCETVIDQNLNISWTCNSRVDTVGREILSLMARAGCWMISFGIESGNPKVLDAMKKRISPDQILRAVSLANEAGMETVGHFVLGFPGETEDSMKETVDFALNLGINMAQFYCAVPFPGTPLYDTALRSGWIDNAPFKDFSQDNAVMNIPGLPPSLVNSYRKKGYLKFYSRPGQILNIIKLMKKGGLLSSIKGGLSFLKWINT